MTRHAIDREALGFHGAGARRYRRCRQALTLALSVWIAAAGTVSTIARAQSDGADFRAPVIEHDADSDGVSGEIETFIANVVDNDRLDSVKLFHRYAGEAEFSEQTMQPTAASSYFSARIDTAASKATAIEYYIRAEDVSGNISLSGFAFEPLVRTLTPPVVAAPPAEPVVTAEPGRKLNWLYVGLGVLVLGGAAAALSGGGGDDGGTPDTGGCASECQVTLTISAP